MATSNPYHNEAVPMHKRQANIASSLAAGNVASWEAYQRTVGTNLGLQETLDLINKMLKEDAEDER